MPPIHKVSIIIVDDFTLKNFHVLNTINSFFCAKQDGKAKKITFGKLVFTVAISIEDYYYYLIYRQKITQKQSDRRKKPRK